jgi:uncharacterized membrane protein YGL010W
LVLGATTGKDAGLKPAATFAGLTRWNVGQLERYMAQYDHEHTDPWNKFLHAVGIPIILAGIVLLAMRYWRLGAALFVGGWILNFLGHRIEGNKPAFFQGLIYFLVGPLWVAKELKDAVFGARRKSPVAR